MKKRLDIDTRKALGKVIENNIDYLVRFAIFRIGNRVEAEEIVHEAVVKLLEKDISQISPDSFRLYLFRIVYNLCCDYSNNRSVFIPYNASIDSLAEDEDLLDTEEIERINSILEELPVKEQEVIRMNVIDGLSFVDIGRILSFPVSTVKSRFKSGMNKLKAKYFDK